MDNLGFKSDALAVALTIMVCTAVAGGLLYAASQPSAAALPAAAQSTQVEVTALIFEAAAVPEPENVPPEEPPAEDKLTEETQEEEPAEVKEPEPPEPEPEEPVLETEAIPVPVVEKPKPQPKPQPKPKKQVKQQKPQPRPAPSAESSRGAAVQGSTEISGVTLPTAADTAAVEQQASYDRALAVLLREVRARKSYPPRARQQGVQGSCVIRFTVNAAGVVTGSSLQKSSGSSLLDSACRRTGEAIVGCATGASRAVNVNVPLQFKLTD